MARWLIPALAVLMVVAARPVPVAATTPIRVAVIIPANYPLYATDTALCAGVESWLHDIQDWWITEVNKTFDYQLLCVHSSLTIYEMQVQSGGGFDGCATAPIPEGWLGTDVLGMQSIAYAETGWISSGKVRDWFIGIGFGGDASAYHGHGGPNDYGRLFLGDWALHEDVVGPAACNPYGLQGCRPLGHEALHTMDVSNNNDKWCGDVLSASDRRELINNNKAFLRSP